MRALSLLTERIDVMFDDAAQEHRKIADDAIALLKKAEEEERDRWLWMSTLMLWGSESLKRPEVQEMARKIFEARKSACHS